MNAPPSVKWITPHILAHRWGVNRMTILRLIRSGELPVLKINARVFRIAEVDAAALYARKYSSCIQLDTNCNG